MTRFRKKPVVIDAVYFDEGTDGANAVGNFLTDHGATGHSFSDDAWHIATLEGTMRADRGDYVIRGVKGEFYPCKPDIFEATYEEVKPVPISGVDAVKDATKPSLHHP